MTKRTMVILLLGSAFFSSLFVFAQQTRLNVVFDEVTQMMDMLCIGPEFTRLELLQNKVKDITKNKKYQKYNSFLANLNVYFDRLLPGCYNPEHKTPHLAELSFVMTQGIEAADWESLLPPSSGYFRRFYHVYYTWKGADPQNPVLQFTIPKESGCLQAIWWRSKYNDMYYSADNGKIWNRRKTNDPSCVPATHVKIIPSSKNGLGTEYLNSHFVSLHLGTKVMANKDLCVDVTYSADNAQYLERTICEKIGASLAITNIDGFAQQYGFDYGTKAHEEWWSQQIRQGTSN